MRAQPSPSTAEQRRYTHRSTSMHAGMRSNGYLYSVVIRFPAHTYMDPLTPHATVCTCSMCGPFNPSMFAESKMVVSMGLPD